MPKGAEGVNLDPSQGTGVYERVVYSKNMDQERMLRYSDDHVDKGVNRYTPALRNMIPFRSASPTAPTGRARIDEAGLFSFVTYSWVFQYLLSALRGKVDRDQVWICSFYDSCGLNMAREKKANPSKPSLFKVIYRFIFTRLWTSCAVFLFCLIFGFIGPTCFIRRLIAFAEQPLRDGDDNVNYLYGMGMVLSIVLVEVARVLMYGATWAVSYRTGIRVRGAVLALLYKQVLEAKDLCGKPSSEIVNIFANDGQRLFDAITFAPLVIVGPLVLFGGIGYLLAVIGPWSLLGIAIFFVFDAIQYMLGKTMVRCRSLAVEKTESRINLMGEIIRFIRVIKVNSWEDIFSRKIDEMRHSEKINIRKSGYAQSLAIACGPVVPVVAAILTFLGVVLSGNDLLASDAFSAITVFFVMLFGIRMIPYGSRYMAEAVVAIRRIEIFLKLERWEQITSYQGQPSVPVVSRNAVFSYLPVQEQTPTPTETDPINTANPVFNIHFGDLQVKKGEHVAVCGGVGSGKSALLKALSGHMFLVSGELDIDWSNVGYVTQTPWIMNGTVQDNVLFGEKMSSERYYKVIESSQLSKDLHTLATGDRTEIGERGATLSGGQKARVSLARTLFANRAVYLLDDILASLDQSVADKIFEDAICDFLGKKTVLMVTNNTKLLPRFDRVLFVENGRIVADGTHEDLITVEDNYRAFVESCEQEHGAYDTDDFDTTNFLPHAATLDEEFEKIGAPAAHDSSENIVQSSERDKLVSDEEDFGLAAMSWKVYKSYVVAAGSWGVWLCLFAGFVINISASIFSTYWLSRWLKKGHQEEYTEVNGTTQLLSSGSLADSPDTSFYASVYGVSLVVLFLSGLFKAVVFVKVSLNAATKLHNSMFTSLIRGATSFFDSTPSGRILNRFSKDMDEIDVKLPFTAEVFLQNMITCLGFLMVIAWVFPWFLVACFPLLGIFVLFVSCFRAGIRNLKRSENISRSPLFDHVSSSLEGLAAIHSLHQSQRYMDNLKKHLDANSGAVFMFQSAMRWLAVWLDLLVVAMTAVVALLIVLLTGKVSPADAGMAIAFAVQMSGIFQFAVRTQTELEAKMTSVERVSYYAQNIDPEDSFETQKGVSIPMDWPSQGQINFQEVKLRYRPKLPLALNDISFQIAPGEKIGIIGRTGSGKSSLASLLCRLYPLTWGRIFIDGVDTKTVGLNRLRRALAVIPQDPSLFAGTVRFNLDPRNEFSDSDLWSALEKTYLKDAITALDKKLEAEVNSGGENFSVGERQLFCMTRALLSKAKIVILDEATASLDVNTDKLIQKVISDVFSNCTVLTIAHRLDNVKKMDRVLFLENGKMIEFTTPDLLFKKGLSELKSFVDTAEGSNDSSSAVVVNDSDGQSSPEVIGSEARESGDEESVVVIEKESSSDAEIELIEH
ncbi:unnamed protein product [Caenorhabditis auriculariae]|uniref:Uncharacterized protein n=1 Tax=Caenorhabditis auriculariae TaxID=2777116 RepID=A0A8S1GYG2_9PELO|nr:unnamed protein product [Caenorhabditis auriculariae]